MTEHLNSKIKNKVNLSNVLQEDLCGKELAHCKIEKKLGQGAMGIVYLGEQINMRRKVAVKVLDPKFSRDLVYIERFEREAQATARLVHFNIVQVYDFGREDETYYIVSEYVDGCTVQDLIEEQGTLSCEHATEIVLQAARGLAVAEEASIVHRDIKPENLMITREGVVKITDFGLAKVVKDDAGVTQSGMIVGTPFYMSPEQAKGENLDIRSDLYSLGVAYFHAVTGQIPFDGDSVISVLLQHISGERPNPSDINPAVPKIVSNVILKMLHKDQDGRYQTFDELVSELESLLSRLRSGDLGEEAIDAEGVSDNDKERMKHYKRLKRSLVAKLTVKEAPQTVIEKMKAKLTDDEGVFVETSDIYSVDTLVEVRFTVPGRTGLVEALGIVRWAIDTGPSQGIGVTFLRVKPIEGPKPKLHESAIARRSEMNRTDLLKALTATPIDSRLMRYYYANTGKSVTINNIANNLGVGTKLVEAHLRTYRSLGLIADKGNSSIIFVWPDDEALQGVILDWIQKHGLK